MEFKINRIPEILGENLNPSYFLLNLNPKTASRANENDVTTPVITWLELIIFIIILIIILKKWNVIKR